MQLRWYQQEAIDATLTYWRRGGGNPLVELATGAGKTAVLCALIKTICEGKNARVLSLAHRKELIEQSASTMPRIWRDASVGVFAASLGRKQVRQVTFAQIQTAYRHASDFGHVDLVCIDEAHLTPPDGEGQYQQLLAGLRDTNPDLRIFGLTATPYRLGQGMLTWGNDRIFDSIVYRTDILRLIEEGFLAPLVTRSCQQIDVSGIKVARGDFVHAALETAACDENAIGAVANDVARAIQEGRTSALVFATGVEHAKLLRNALAMRGLSCEVITGETDARERSRTIDAFRARRIQAIANADVLTTGFDATCVDVLAIARPTMSAALWVQMCGRGMRIDDGKHDCLVLDYGGNIDRHGPIDRIEPKQKMESKGGAAPTKSCPQCMAEVHASSSTCGECDFEFPPPPRVVRTQAATGDVIGGQKPHAEDRVVPVVGVEYKLHVSARSGSATLRVDYHPTDGGLPISEWVCLEHDVESFAWRKAAGWWVKAGGKRPAPESIEDAIGRLDELDRPTGITIRPEGKYTRVVEVKWAKRDDEPPPPAPEMTDDFWSKTDDELPF